MMRRKVKNDIQFIIIICISAITGWKLGDYLFEKL